MDKAVIVSLNEEAPPGLDGRTFQVHVLPGGFLKLYPVEIEPADSRCPVRVGGERCALESGHVGKHCWGSGD